MAEESAEILPHGAEFDANLVSDEEFRAILREMEESRSREALVIEEHALDYDDVEVAADSGAILALPGRKFPLKAVPEADQRYFLDVNGLRVVVSERPNTGKGTGLTSWDGAVVLAKYLERVRQTDIEGKRVLELGSGTGIVGLAAAACGASTVVLTDLEYVCTNLRNDTLPANPHFTGRVQVEELDWFHPQAFRHGLGSFDVVLGADIVWIEELIPPLVSVLGSLASPQRLVLLAHQTRSRRSDSLLFSELAKRGLSAVPVPFEELHSQYRDRDIQIFRIVPART